MKRIVSGTISMLLLISILSSAFIVQPVKASGTIYIRADGSIDPPTASISTVDNITYTFTGNIYDSIIVERDNIVVDGAGYTVQGIGGSGEGIQLYGRSYVTIQNTNIKNFYYSIRLENSHYNFIYGNTLANSGGIVLSSSRNNTISGNTFVGGGLYVQSFSYWNVVEDNVVNGKPLVYLEDASHQTIANAGQVILVNCNGIQVENLNLSHTTLGVELYNTNSTIIKGNNITANIMSGILLSGSFNNTISGNNITDNGYYGVSLTTLYSPGGISSFNNTISGNTVAYNVYGIRLSESFNNGISGNNINNNDYGILFSSSGSNTISGNTIAYNDYGIWFSYSGNNIFYHNNFINNIEQVHRETSGNDMWDDGYPSGGNYWSDYTGDDLKGGPYQVQPGSDGIGDLLYVINADNRDRYPLMNPYLDFSFRWKGETYPVDVTSNSTLTEFHFSRESKRISFKVGGSNGTSGFCDISIPRVLLDASPGEWTVSVDDTVPADLTITQNDTHTSIYFTYTHSLRTVQIIGTQVIPEFPSLLILPLFMIATLLAIIIYRKKQF